MKLEIDQVFNNEFDNRFDNGVDQGKDDGKILVFRKMIKAGMSREFAQKCTEHSNR